MNITSAPVVAHSPEPVDFSELMSGDLITFGTCKTEWKILDTHTSLTDEVVLLVECIKHPDTAQFGRLHHVYENRGHTRIYRLI